MLHYLKTVLLVGTLILFGAGCAKQAPPDGNPETVQQSPADDLPQDIEGLPPLPEQEENFTDEELDKAEKEDDALPQPSIQQDEQHPPEQEAVY